MDVSPVQTAFTAGELSPRLLGRIDLEKYYLGAAKLTNFISLPHGPLMRRAGSTYIEQGIGIKGRLISFSFNIKQSFVIELCNKKAHFFLDGGVVTKDNVTYEITTPWPNSILYELSYAQSGDIIYIVHPSGGPWKLSRLGNNNWTLAAVSLTAKPWGDDEAPSQVCFHEQRLYYAASAKHPQTIWASRVAQYDDFTMISPPLPSQDIPQEVYDDHAFAYTIASDDVNGIQWLKAGDILCAGTSGAEYKISPSSSNESLTPSNVRISRQTSYGSAGIQAKQLGPSLVFVKRSKDRVMAFEFSYLDGQYVASDLTIYSEHIARSGIKDISTQSAKDTYLWCLLEDGALACFTYEKAQKVLAWHRHEIADGKIKSMVVIPGVDSDQVWMLVERTINGQTVAHIEAFLNAMTDSEDVAECQYLDSHLSYVGTPIVQIGGLNHLEGKEVSILVDGWVHPNEVVTNGSVVLQTSGSKIHVGLPYKSRFESVPVQATEAVTLGRKKRIRGLALSFLSSLGFSFGIKGERMQEFYMGPTRVMDRAVPLFTGSVNCVVPGSTDTERQVVIEQELPLPCIIRGIRYKMEVHE